MDEESCRLFDLVVLTAIIGCLCLVGITGNLTSLFVLRRHNAKTGTMFLLQCLAVSDAMLLVCSLVMYSLTPILTYARMSDAVKDACQDMSLYVWPFALMAHTATVWLTVLVTVTRYQTICSKTVNVVSSQVGRWRVYVVGVVIFAVLYNLPRFFEHQLTAESPPSELTSYHMNASNSTTAPLEEVSTRPSKVGDSQMYQIIYSNILYFPVMYIIPLVLLAFLNIKLVSAVRVIRLRKRSLTGSSQRRSPDHITGCVIVIVFVFICCQTPALINQIFWATTTDVERRCGLFHYYYTRLSDVLVVLNSSVNFVIYCLFGKTFRKIFLDTLRIGSPVKKKVYLEVGGGCERQMLDVPRPFTNGTSQPLATSDHFLAPLSHC